MTIAAATDFGSPPATPRDSPVEFAGDRRAFRQLVVRGAFAELLTLGFYRFWLATATRRVLWSSTAVDGEPFEYHGTARELFLGLVFAVAILAPFYLLNFLLGVEAERQKTFASLPLVLAFVLFRQFAIYRARRYRLHRTSWRGIRFGMTGSGWKYAAIAAMRGGLNGLTLGAALPWSQAALERYKMNHTTFGELEGRFEGTGGELFKRGWWLWALMFFAPLAFLLLTATGTKNGFAAASILLITVVGAPFWYATFKAIEWKWWLEGLRIGGMSVSSNLSPRALIGTYWKVAGFLILIFVVAIIVAIAGTYGMTLAGFSMPKAGSKGSIPLPFLVVWGATYLLALLGFGVVFRIYLLRRVWQIVSDSATVHHVEQADDVAARPGSASALGEGFADSLDLFGF